MRYGLETLWVAFKYLFGRIRHDQHGLILKFMALATLPLCTVSGRGAHDAAIWKSFRLSGQ